MVMKATVEAMIEEMRSQIMEEMERKENSWDLERRELKRKITAQEALLKNFMREDKTHKKEQEEVTELLSRKLSKHSDHAKLVEAQEKNIITSFENACKASKNSMKVSSESLLREVQRMIDQFSEEQYKQNSAINQHSEILSFVKEKLQISMNEAEETTPEWVTALALLEKQLNEDLDELKKSLDEFKDGFSL